MAFFIRIIFVYDNSSSDDVVYDKIFVLSRIAIMEIQELKALIKESIREVLREERMLLCQVLIPYVSEEEQEELDTEFGSPSDYEDEELVDMTDWVKHGHKIS